MEERFETPQMAEGLDGPSFSDSDMEEAKVQIDGAPKNSRSSTDRKNRDRPICLLSGDKVVWLLSPHPPDFNVPSQVGHSSLSRKILAQVVTAFWQQDKEFSWARSA